MKRMRVILLLAMAFILLAGAAFAEETGSAGKTTELDGYTVRLQDDGCWIAGVPETAVQDGILTIPETVGEKQVFGYLPSAVGEDVRLVIQPRNNGIVCEEDADAPDKTIRFHVLAYAGFKELSPEELDKLPDMQKGEYALTDFYQIAVSRNGSVNQSYNGEDFLFDNEIPGELFGQKAYCLVNPSRVAQTEGDWTFTCQGEGRDRQAVIRRYAGAQEKVLVIPDQLDGVYVTGFPFEIISEQTEFVYVPENCWFNELKDGSEDAQRSFIQIRYISFEKAEQNQSSLVSEIPEFTAGTYALTNMERFTYNGSSYNSSAFEDYIPVEDILSEINGKKALANWISGQLIAREGDWSYSRLRYEDGNAILLRYAGEAAESFVIPAKIGSYRVAGVALQAIPENARYVYLPYRCDVRTDDRYNQEKTSRSIIQVRYLSYDQIKQDYNYLLENNPSISEGVLTISDMDQWSYNSAEQSTSYSGMSEIVPAEALLTEINGMPLEYAPVRRNIGMKSGEFVYANDYDNRAVILSMPATQETLLIPATMEGLQVTQVESSAVPDEVKALLLPRDCYLRSNDKLTHDVKVYHYQDYDMIHAEDYISSTAAMVQPGELFVNWVQLYTPGKSEDLVQDFYDYPTEYNGQKIHLSINRNNVLTHESGSFTYYKVSETEICICEFSDKEARKVTVPDTIDGLTVVGLNALGGGSRVLDISNATEITLPSTLRILGYYAIHNSKAKNITLPAGLKEIGEHALYLGGVQNLTIPDGVESIGSYGINLAYRAKKLVIPASVKVLAPDALAYANSLQAVELPAGLTELPAGFFKNFYRLTAVSIPAGITEIKESTFNGCNRLTKVTFQGAAIKKIGDSAFVDCAALGKIDLPEGVEEIGYQAFYGCKKLNNVTIPSTVTKIGASAFEGCRGLARVNIGANVTEIADNAFNECSKSITFFTPEGSYARQWAEAKGFKVKELK